MWKCENMHMCNEYVEFIKAPEGRYVSSAGVNKNKNLDHVELRRSEILVVAPGQTR
jgi:hypothetical protein